MGSPSVQASHFQLISLLIMNFFSICKRDAQQHIQPEEMYHNSSRQTTPKVQRNTKRRREIQAGDFIYDCPIGDNQSCISGQVYIKRKETGSIIFQGIYYNNQKNGFGIQYDDNEEIIFQGQYKNDMKDGWGSTPIYQGRFKQDQYDGWGRLITKEAFYQGYFSEGAFNGFGIYMKGNEELKELEKLKAEEKIDEYILLSIQKSPDKLFQDHNLKQIYLGQFTKGLKNGSGKLHRDNGQWYVGQFSYDMMHGNGSHLEHKNAEIQKGVFVKGKFSEK